MAATTPPAKQGFNTPSLPLAARPQGDERRRPPDPSASFSEGVAPTAAVEHRDRTFRRLLAYSDIIAALVSLLVTVTVLGDDQLNWSLFLGLPFIVVAGKTHGLYDRDELTMRKSTLDEAPALFQLTTLYTLVLWICDGIVINGALGHEQVLVLWATLFATSFWGRVAARRLAQHATPHERAIFIGDAETFSRLQGKVGGMSGVELVGRMSLQRTARRGQRNHDTRELTELICWTNAHRIIIEPQTLPQEEMLDLVRAAKGVGVRVSLLPRIFDVVGTSVVFDEIKGMTVLGVRRFGLSRSSQLLKRAFDVAAASVIVVLIAPVLAAVALAIKLDSRGPVLFRQTRIGRDGTAFRICKFRTMCVDAEARKAELRVVNEARGGLFKIADDPRITRVGAFLRKTSLDELPQLFNVLAGSMSIVGPRPLVADEDEQITGYDRHRLALTPGMTGHWQIAGSARVPLPEMVQIDYLYVAGWSLWTDLKTILRTIPYVLSRRGM